MQEYFLHMQEENMCAGNIPTHVGIFPARAGRNENVQEYFLHMQEEI